MKLMFPVKRENAQKYNKNKSNWNEINKPNSLQNIIMGIYFILCTLVVNSIQENGDINSNNKKGGKTH